MNLMSRLEISLEGIRFQVANALNDYSDELKKSVDAKLKAAIEKLSIEGEIDRIINEEIRTKARDIVRSKIHLLVGDVLDGHNMRGRIEKAVIEELNASHPSH